MFDRLDWSYDDYLYQMAEDAGYTPMEIEEAEVPYKNNPWGTDPDMEEYPF